MIYHMQIQKQKIPIIIEDILSHLNRDIKNIMEGLGENLEKKILEIINFLEIKLQFHFTPKVITYRVESYNQNTTRSIILPFWPILQIDEILTIKGEKIMDYEWRGNKILISPLENSPLTPSLITYTIGYKWDSLKDFLPILIYIIEYYLKQSMDSYEFHTPTEIKNLMDDIKNLYGKGDF